MANALSNFKFHDGTAPTSNPFGLALGVHVYESVLK